MSELEIIEGEDLEKRIAIAAYHEAGHAAIAARLGLRLRAEGIMVTFWNLRAAGLNLRFLDQKQQERMTWITQEWLQNLVTQSSSRRAEDTISIRARSQAEFETAPDVEPFPSWRVFDDY